MADVTDATDATHLRLDHLTGAWQGPAERAEGVVGGGGAALPPGGEAGGGPGGLAAGDGSDRCGREAEGVLREVLDAAESRSIIGVRLEATSVLGRPRLGAGDTQEALALTEDPMRLAVDKAIRIWAADITTVRVADQPADRRGAAEVAEYGRGAGQPPGASAPGG
jgi:hypothetical protein